jgi:hypothetical protein
MSSLKTSHIMAIQMADSRLLFNRDYVEAEGGCSTLSGATNEVESASRAVHPSAASLAAPRQQNGWRAPQPWQSGRTLHIR